MTFGPPPSPFTQSALSADSARKKRRTKLLGAVGAVVVAVLCAGGWLLWYAGEDRTPAHDRPSAARQTPDDIRQTVEKLPGTPEGELVVDYAEEGLKKDKTVYAPGTWATDKILAKAVGSRLLGINARTYEEEAEWTLKLDGPVCATTRHVTADGRTAVVVQPSRPKGSDSEGVCDELVFFDIDTGKKLWQKKLPDADTAFVTNTNLTMTGGTVAVAWDAGSVAYGMSDGKQLWKSTSRSACEDTGFAGGRNLLALVKCDRQGEPTFKVEKLDPRTGKVRWTYQVSSGIQRVFLPSSDPPVLAVAAGDDSVTDLISLDARGRHRATITLGDKFDPSCDRSYFGVVENCDAIVVGREQVFVASEEQFENGQPANWITGWDLATGKTTKKFDGRPLQKIHPLRMSGDKLLAYRESSDNIGPAAVVRLDPRTGKETPYLFFNLPSDDVARLEDPSTADIVVEQGKVFFSPRELRPDPKFPKYPVRAVLGIDSVT
ncbi:hypothetical protein FE633_42625 [Streptomyces montanus]|uniref:Pyrrolo-quinoline quinone repeat domain-containing protein n=1 Tax=Streptomyces montanus TaxID=2580423 RepID=A0A5R9FCN6_9ACTN|nr:PQQ-binding-like beta-propeller repeat protein [Streptomyces montanus]TLS40239.1 hypothetical protein FE633_42625 [Streptomyces montanus]